MAVVRPILLQNLRRYFFNISDGQGNLCNQDWYFRRFWAILLEVIFSLQQPACRQTIKNSTPYQPPPPSTLSSSSSSSSSSSYINATEVPKLHTLLPLNLANSPPHRRHSPISARGENNQQPSTSPLTPPAKEKKNCPNPPLATPSSISGIRVCSCFSKGVLFTETSDVGCWLPKPKRRRWRRRRRPPPTETVNHGCYQSKENTALAFLQDEYSHNLCHDDGTLSRILHPYLQVFKE